MRALALASILLWAPPALPDPGAAPGPAPAAPAAGPAAAPASEGPITVTTRLTPEPSSIGDLLTFEVIVAYPRDHSVNLPTGLDFSPLHLVEIAEGEVESTGQDLRQRYTITLQHFEVGASEVPSFPITWIDPADEVHTYTVPPHSFEVQSLLANEADPEVRGEDPMISLEYPNLRGAIIIDSVLGGVLLAGLLAAALVMWRRRERPVVLPPPVPPHERALADLAALGKEREALIEAGAYQDYYLRLTEIAKRYLGGRFGFEALDRTTEEIQDLLRRRQVELAPLDPDEVLTFLQDCDLVKFARLSPPEEEAREALGLVRGMVERSMPREPDPDRGPDQAPSQGGDAPAPANSSGTGAEAAPRSELERARAERPTPPGPEEAEGPPDPEVRP